MTQLSLFSDDHPAGNSAIQPALQFGDKVRQVEIGGKLHFSILDILKHFGSEGSEKNPRVYWERSVNRLKEQGDEVVTLKLQLHQFPGQGQRPTPVLPLEGFLRVVQVIEIREWEHLRQWMASLGAQVTTEGYALAPGASPELLVDKAIDRYERRGKDRAWIETRVQGIQARKEITAVIRHVVTSAGGKDKDVSNAISAFTDEEYLALFQRRAAQLRAETGDRSPRDSMTRHALAGLMLVEGAVSELVKDNDLLTYADMVKVLREVVSVIKPGLDSLSAMLKVDLATGKPLLQA